MVFSSLTALEPDTTTTTLSHKHRDETTMIIRETDLSRVWFKNCKT